MKRSFRERDPLKMGVVGIATVILLVLLSFNLTRFEGGTGYTAAFTEASGLKPSEDVRIAGVKVGKVKKVALEGDHVKVAFTVERQGAVRLATRGHRSRSPRSWARTTSPSSPVAGSGSRRTRRSRPRVRRRRTTWCPRCRT